MDHEQVADHYNARPNESRDVRRQSRIYHMRQFNNWLKFVLIDLHTRPNCSALDLCCGKGGDLQKWIMVNCASYVGCDIAKVSVHIAADRFNEGMYMKCPFRPRLFVGDMFSVKLIEHMDDSDDVKFDIVSCQFSMHYAFESENRVRRLLENVSDRLKPGGFFVGTTIDANVLIRKIRAVDELEISSGVYHIRFDKRHADKSFPIRRQKTNSDDAKSKKKKKAIKREKQKLAKRSNDDESDDADLKKKSRKRKMEDYVGNDKKKVKLEGTNSSSRDDEDDKDISNGGGDDDDGDDDDGGDDNDDDGGDDDDNDDDDGGDGGNDNDDDKNGNGDNEKEKIKRNYPYGIRYTFSLDQSVVDCPEYIVHFPTFKKLALEYDLELVMLCNFHDFFTEFTSDKYPNYRRLLSTYKVVDENGSMSPDEWDAIYLYTAFAFKKRGQSADQSIPASDQLVKRQWDPIDKDEIVVIKS